jgi:hypothetical protein
MTTLSTIIVPSGILTNSDIGTSVQAYDADTTKNDVANTFTTGQTINGNLDLNASTTEYRSIEIGKNRTGDGFAYVDLVGDATYSDYGARFIRNNTGADTTTDLIHRGTDSLRITAQDAGYVDLRTNNIRRLSITPNGGFSTGNSVTAYGTSNQVLASNGDAPPSWIDNISDINRVILTSGTTYTVPSNLLYAEVFAQGGGGGGGGNDNNDTGSEIAAGGGGAGGCAIKFYTKAEIGTSCTYSLGAGGTGGAIASNGGDGGTTTFTANGTYTTTLTGNGGTGGEGGSGAGVAEFSGRGGGTASGGDIPSPGGSGFDGYAVTELTQGGDGGNSKISGGGIGATVVAAGTANGDAGLYGSGGGGSSAVDNTAGATGGAGGDGCIFIIEYLAG